MSANVHPTGIHHLAVMTADMKSQLEFFSDVLGCRLVAIFDMHGVPGGIHAFLELSQDCQFSLVQLPGTGDIATEIGATHAGWGGGNSAPGTMQHLALGVQQRDQLLAMRDRIRDRGVNVYGPIDHGMCQSIYFAGPENLVLEVAWSESAIDPASWIDPSAAEKIGISAEELAGYAEPAAYAGEGGKVAQPPIDPSKPHQAMDPERYKQVIAAPDEVIWQMASYAEPPVNEPTE
ncbi:VOC family protein [Parerythrobacter jejuensis]|uniref:VOC family protein n=1 Tax=Parerythrobacter jejuensis TaxID=795812 RepID=A0A845B1S7_9SPHN|nr:VOC family protein [Parerythrobacter jejuensis]MXP32938.1 VOC family protein [Parerythrobacter jejuensis]